MIASIFPKVISHLNNKSKKENISIFNFIETHFTLGTGNTTPRIIVMYLDKCLAQTKSYYKSNPLDKVEIDQNNEYPLVNRETALSAYKELQLLIHETFTRISTKWEQNIKLFRSKKNSKFIFQLDDMKKVSNIDGPELEHFIAFLCHIGYLKCTDTYKTYDKRTYTLPILFR
jgi:hypothetical protein